MKRFFPLTSVLILLCLIVMMNRETSSSPATEVNWINGNLPSKSFDGLVEESDIIAKVKIESIKEVHQEKGITNFQSKVLKYYKNKTTNTDIIHIFQAATPKEQFRQNPILEVGKSYILFLREMKVPKKEQPAFGEKVLLFVGEGYARFSIDHGKVMPFLVPRRQEQLKNSISLPQFEDLLRHQLYIRSVLDEFNMKEYLNDHIGSRRMGGDLFSVYEVLDTEETDDLIKFYLWVRCSEFKNNNGELKTGISVNLPVVIYAQREGNHVKLVRHESPIGAGHYEDEVKGLFPAKENLQSNLHFVSSLITSAITVKTRRSIYGLMRLLQRDIFTNELKEEMKKLMEVPIHDKMKSKLSAVHKVTNTDEMRSLLVSEMISILGQPLGIGQGFNPTCQSTRALSYWSQKEPVMLLAMFNQFLEHGKITMDFEGRTISSDTLPLVQLVDEIHIDTISLIFIPHLDSIYFQMLNSVKRIGQDPHKWINPAFHIKGIWTGFSDVYSDFEFKAKFRRYYHPSSNPNVNKGLPQPAGITIYNHSGQVLGAHAVLIQRVAPDPSGCIRVYFYNPNNDSLQVWGNAIRTSVAKNGEQAGESSLPFDDFLSFLYAFHFPKKFGSLI
ncbi:hypothetical protein [Ammoniphilus sp. 3BR4]|uniref:hypothetical protein n=1 Tax=Ammoniphilus sp. 3BR4 TaxID=3158265 RepID=UPI003465DC00